MSVDLDYEQREHDAALASWGGDDEGALTDESTTRRRERLSRSRAFVERGALTCECAACRLPARSVADVSPHRIRREPAPLALARAAYESAQRYAAEEVVPMGHLVSGVTVALLLRFALDRCDEMLRSVRRPLSVIGDTATQDGFWRIEADALANRCYQFAHRHAIALTGGLS